MLRCGSASNPALSSVSPREPGRSPKWVHGESSSSRWETPKSWGRTPSSDPVFAECIDSGCALLEFGGDIDWSDARYDDHDAVRQRWRQDKDPDATAYDTDVQAIWRFRVEMRRGGHRRGI